MGTWGFELWDQREILEKHTHSGIDFLDKCAGFIKERIRVEQEYAKSLRRLVKQYQFKKKEEEDLPFTYQHSFKNFLQENDDFAGQREVIAEELYNNILKEMQKLSLESKVERKKTLQKMTEHKNLLDQHYKTLTIAKKKYDQASEEACTALKGYENASQSLDLTKAQILRFQKTSQDKGMLAEKACESYKASLSTYNGKQTLYYEGEMPGIINRELQELEEKRISKLSLFLQEYSLTQQKVAPIIAKCVEGMFDAAKLCDPALDSATLIDRYKSGELHPCDAIFEEWGKPAMGSNISLSSQRSTTKAAKSKPSLFSKKKEILSHENFANDYADLPPAQRRKKFNKAISSLEDQLSQLEKAKAGLLKIKETSEKFGGDIDTIQSQIEANEKETERLKPLLHQYQCYLAAAIDGEITRKNSRLSFVDGNTTSPSSGIEPVAESMENQVSINTSFSSTTTSSPPLSPASEFIADEFDEMRCTVLYDFSGSNEGEITVFAGEELTLTDEDDGSGWTRVIRGSEEGYIPTSYIERI